MLAKAYQLSFSSKKRRKSGGILCAPFHKPLRRGKVAVTSSVSSVLNDAFQTQFSGDFGAVVREYVLFSEENDDSRVFWKGINVPLRYVHGVGVVPISSMPFADKVFEANARVTCGVVKGLFEIETKRSFPEVGEEASMGSCGGSEWNERTRYAEDRKYFLSSGGAFEALRTVDETGSFTAGPKTLGSASSNSSSSSSSNSSGSKSKSSGCDDEGKEATEEEEEDFGMTWFPTHENESSVRFGLQWDAMKRVRVEYHVKKTTGTVGCAIWSERKGECAPRGDGGEGGVLGGEKKKWSNFAKKSILRERAFVLEKDEDAAATKFTNVSPNSPSLAAISSESLLLFENGNPIALPCGKDVVYVSSSLKHHAKNTGKTEEEAATATTCFAAAVEIDGGGKTLLWTRAYDSRGLLKFAHFAELVG
ncbi:unnamed protein product [Bathycoccus prasinos]